MNRNIFKILFFFGIFFFGNFVTYGADYYQVGNNTVQCINEHGVNKAIENKIGSSIFIPTKTSLEWSTFRTNKPLNVYEFNTLWNTGSWSSCSATPTWGSWGSWGACSVSCGGGTQTRYRTCINTTGTQTRSVNCNLSDGRGVANSCCTGAQPSTSQSCSGTCIGASSESQLCNTGACALNGTCGSSNGTTVSTAPTINLCNTGIPGVVSGSGPWTWSCNGIGGGTTASCSANKTVTYTYSWNIGTWGACSVGCGGGTQTRIVVCRRSDGVTVSDSFCTGVKPVMSQTCNIGACGPLNCSLPWGGVIAHGFSVMAYPYTTGYVYIQNCGGINRTCNNGILSNPIHWITGLPAIYSTCTTAGDCPSGYYPWPCPDSGAYCGCAPDLGAG